MATVRASGGGASRPEAALHQRLIDSDGEGAAHGHSHAGAAGDHNHSHGGAGSHVVSPATSRPSKPVATSTTSASNATLAADQAAARRAKCQLIAAMVFCFAFMAAEVVGGYLAHSLAIMTE